MTAEVDKQLGSLRQAGGGGSEAQRTTPTLNSVTLSYLKGVFTSHAGSDQSWTTGQVERFIHDVQQSNDLTAAAKRVLGKESIDLNDFLQYMTSQDSAITLPWKKCDLSWPLTNYFISSSHNTYLTGNQLYSDSTTGAYTNVLLRGCRCVEIDVWDGEDDASSVSSQEQEEAPGKLNRRSTYDRFRQRIPGGLAAKLESTGLGKKLKRHSLQRADKKAAPRKPGPKSQRVPAVVEPRVLHGYTLTKEVSFRDVCDAIRESGFVASDLPLIISLEVHCGPDQQVMMAKIMKESWRGMLVTEEEVKANGERPSLENLKGRILIKVKRGAVNHDEPVDTDEDERLPESDMETAAALRPPAKPSKIVPELGGMGIYTQAVSFKRWSQPEAKHPAHIFSLSEKRFLEHREKHPHELFEHNRNYLMRAYPSGLRIRSSNIKPTAFWAGGAQVVALNWQQTDNGIMLNEGMFAGTGGYVLKPEGYRSNIGSSGAICHRNVASLSITVLSAQGISLPSGDASSKKFNPYLKMELHTEASDWPTHSKGAQGEASDAEDESIDGVRHKTRTKTHKGCDVDFGAQKLEFTNITSIVEELTFVRFMVRDDELGVDDLAAWACVRLDRLGSGYRFIHLLDSKGRLTEGTILVKVDVVVEG